MAQNTGTLVIAAVRPNDSLDLIASAFAEEIKGGHHQYARFASMSLIIKERREWGMLSTIYDDGANNGTYQLVYGASDTNIMNNNNWVPFSGGGGGQSTEWISSVVSQIDSPPGSTPSDGARYLIATPSFGVFVTQSNKIGVWSNAAGGGLGDWSYITPLDGFTLRRDDELNVLYKYTGTWSLNNNWKKEYINQVRYIQPISTDGGTYSFTSSTNLVPLDVYSYSTYFANFGFTNSGPSKLQIDGLGYYDMKKLSSSGLVNLSSQDLVPNVQYHLSWNQDSFMVHGLGGGGASAGVIGPAEDGDGSYSDGLYTDLTASTPIGVPIDRFNEILKALVPAPAPDLSSWSLGGPQFVTDGRLSFDSSTPGGYVSPPGFPIGSQYTTTTTRLGIISGTQQSKTTAFYQDIVGQLNINVATTSAYDRYAFGNGITGSLVLKLNNATVSNVDLSSTLSQINTSGGVDGGFILSAATNSRFPSGSYFDLFWYRTGTYVLKKTSPKLRKGFNYLELTHNLPSSTLTLASYSWVSDFSPSATTFTPDGIVGINVDSNNGVKTISGIKYFNQVGVDYRVEYLNHVSDTYKNGTPISAETVNITTANNPITQTPSLQGTGVTKIMSASPNQIAIPAPGAPTTPLTYTWSFSLNPNVRRLNESITFQTSVIRTVQGTDTSPGISRGGWLIDNYSLELSTDAVENFEIENYRITNGSSKYQPSITDTTTQIISTYDSTTSLLTNNQLQYCNGVLLYPKYNFRGFGDVQTNPNINNANADYSQTSTSTPFGHGTSSTSTATTNRTFTRRFRVDSTNTFAKVQFTIELINTTFVSVTKPLTSLNPNECWIEVKLPTDTSRPVDGGTIDGGVTGWLDLSKKFDPGFWKNGDGGYTGTIVTSAGITIITAAFGARNTFSSNGYVLLRITASPNWTGYISKITAVGSA